jgi:hypothetical protein
MRDLSAILGATSLPFYRHFLLRTHHNGAHGVRQQHGVAVRNQQARQRDEQLADLQVGVWKGTFWPCVCAPQALF